MTEKKETINATVDPDVFRKIEKERDITPRSTWLNHFFQIFFSSKNKLSLKIEHYRKDRDYPPMRQTIESLLEFALDEKRKQHD